MRLTLLQMTFGKHIERKHVCFFAGEVSTKKRLEYIKCHSEGFNKATCPCHHQNHPFDQDP